MEGTTQSPPGHDQSLVSAQSVESLTKELQTARARIRALETQVRELQAENTTLNPQSSSPSLVQRPTPFHFITFNFEGTDQNDNQSNHQKCPALRELLDLAPKTENDWSQRRDEVGLSTQRSIVKTFLELITATKSRATNSYIGNEPGPTLENTLRDYAGYVKSLKGDAARATQMANYATLLGVSLCRVARKCRVCVNEVDAFMNAVLPETRMGKKRHAPTLKNFRASVRWPVLQAERLKKTIHHRADEFFFLYGPSIPKYQQLWDADKTQSFAEKVILPPPPARREVNADISFSIPFMVKLIAGRAFSLDDINDALETNLCPMEFEASVFDVWRSAQCLRPTSRLVKKQRVQRTYHGGDASGQDDLNRDLSADKETVCAFTKPTIQSTSLNADSGESLNIDQLLVDFHNLLGSSRPVQAFDSTTSLLPADTSSYTLSPNSAPSQASSETHIRHSDDTEAIPLRSQEQGTNTFPCDVPMLASRDHINSPPMTSQGEAYVEIGSPSAMFGVHSTSIEFPPRRKTGGHREAETPGPRGPAISSLGYARLEPPFRASSQEHGKYAQREGPLSSPGVSSSPASPCRSTASTSDPTLQAENCGLPQHTADSAPTCRVSLFGPLDLQVSRVDHPFDGTRHRDGLGDAAEVESRGLATPKNHGVVAGNDWRPTRWNLLLRAAAEQKEAMLNATDHHAGHQANTGSDEAFVESGDRSVMLAAPGVLIEPESDNRAGGRLSCCGTSPMIGEGETDMEELMCVEELFH